MTDNVNLDSLIKRGQMALEDGEWSNAERFFEDALNLNAESGEAYLGKLLVSRRVENVDAYFNSIKLDNSKDGKGVLVNACDPAREHIQQMATRYALPGFLNAQDIIAMYNYNLTFESYVKYNEDNKADNLKKLNENRLFYRTLQFANPATKDKIQSCLSDLTAVFNARIEQSKEEDENTAKKITSEYTKFLAETDARVAQLRAEADASKENYYATQVLAINNNTNITSLNTIKNNLLSLNGYKDSLKYAQVCDQVIADLKNKKEENKKIRRRKTKKRIILSIVLIIVFAILGLAGYIAYQYYTAVELINHKKPNAAIDILHDIHIPKLTEKDMLIAERNALRRTEVGKVVKFGTYETDDKFYNGKETMEWVVLAVDEHSVTLISKEAIEAKCFSEDNVTSWKQSDIREWLNDDFIKLAFNESERDLLKEVDLDNTNGNDTKDQVYLLSADEFYKYRYDANLFECNTTIAARNNGVATGKGRSCQWWLRTTTTDGKSAYMVDIYGKISNVDLDDDEIGVRPVIVVYVGD